MFNESDPKPYRQSDGTGWKDEGPRNVEIDRQNPDMLVPPATDSGTLPNLKFSFSNAHQRLCEGGWAREVTNLELPAATTLAGVNMALEPGAYRELHWHKECEWGFVLRGHARVTAIDEEGRSFIDDVGPNDIWNFEAGIPHSIQGLADGTEFLLVFSDADFSEYKTLLLTDWLAHVPKDILAANFKTSPSELESLPKHEKYIFKGNIPGPLSEVQRPSNHGEVPHPFTFHMNTLQPIVSEAGQVHIIDSKVFPAAQTISAAYVEIEPGGMRELHWHPKAEEWQYYIQGQARMTVFDSGSRARTFDYQAGDVGVCPMVTGHYVLNTGNEPLRFLEVFKNPVYSDISLNKWLATNPAQVVADHLNVTKQFAEHLPNPAAPAPVIWYRH